MDEIKKKRKPRRSKEQVFNDWKKFVEEKKHLPRRYSEDLDERLIACAMAAVLRNMKKEPEKFLEMLHQHKFLSEKYRKKKSFPQLFEEYKKWIEIYDKRPKQSSEDSYEKYLATTMNAASLIMKKNPEKYAEIIEEYEKIKIKYSRRRVSFIKTYNDWITWILENKKIPRQHSKNKYESNLSARMCHVVKVLRKSKELPYIVEEFEKLFSLYGK